MRGWIERWKALTLFEQGLANMMIAWVLLFGSGVVIFWLFPESLVKNLAFFGGYLFDMSRFVELPAPAERFWSALALSLMATLTVLCAFVAWDVRKYQHFTIPVLVSKAASTFFFLHFYWNERPAFAYLGGAIFSDGPIFVATLAVYLLARRGQKKALSRQ